MDMQAMIDGMSVRWQAERAGEQMTLGGLIGRLEELSDTEVDAFSGPQSYRGYYCDLAFEKVEGKISAADLLTMCKGAMGEVYQGYKGGEYQMGRNTPVWIASYGCCGQRILGIRDDGTLELADDE
jgi:hypothetical protein